MSWAFAMQLLIALGPELYKQLQELFSDKIPTIDSLKTQSTDIWKKIAEEQAKA